MMRFAIALELTIVKQLPNIHNPMVNVKGKYGLLFINFVSVKEGLVSANIQGSRSITTYDNEPKHIAMKWIIARI